MHNTIGPYLRQRSAVGLGRRVQPVMLDFRLVRTMKTKTCPDCNGDGVVDKDTDNERQCSTCGGRGFVPDDDDYEEVIKTYPICHAP